MYKKTLISLAVASSLLVTGCFEDSRSDKNAGTTLSITSPGFDGRTWPKFEAVKGEVPLTTDLQFAGTTDGTMNAGTDPANPVVTGIDSLDGNSLVGQFDIEFSGGLDPNQELDASSFITIQTPGGPAVIPNPDQNVFLLPLEYPSTDALVSASGEVPSFAEAIQFQGAVATGDQATFAELATPSARAEIISLDGGTNNVLRISPLEPLKPKTKYLVILTSDIKDRNGNAIIGSPTYQNVRDENAPLFSGLAPVRGAVLNWETLARGYFGFMNTVFTSDDLAPLGLTGPSQDDIALTLTFTTTAIEDVLKANAAPRTFFESSALIDARKDAIELLIAGEYNLTDQPVSGDASPAINSALYQLLTDPTQQFKLFDQDLADNLMTANGNDVSVTFADLGAGSDSQLAFALQTAVSRAAADVSGPTIAAVAEGTETQLSAAIDKPKTRNSRFYAYDDSPLVPGAAFLAQGEIQLPYLLEIPGNDGSVIQTTSWTANDLFGANPSEKVTYRFPFAKKVSDVTVPVLATVPNEAITDAVGIQRPAEGWPVIIFQHGITSDRSASLPLATALASACVEFDANGDPVGQTGLDCFATVAIDQPLHGVTPAGSSVPPANLEMVKNLAGDVVAGASPDITERHFNFTANQQNQAAPMIGNADFDNSGSLFINPGNFTNSRDNLRQGVIDMFNLNASLGAMAIDDGDPQTDDIIFNTDRVYFVGHSLGGINGIPFVAVNNMVAGMGNANPELNPIQAAAFLNTGGQVTKLLENSPTFAPQILGGLAAASPELTQGRSGLETYFKVLQGLQDSTDPISFAKFLENDQVLLTEIIGDNVVPNAADSDLYATGPLQIVTGTGFTINSLPAPLAGTEPLAARFGAEPTADGVLPAISRFIEGNHSNPVDNEPEAVFDEMVSQIGQLFTSGSITVTNPAVIESTGN